MEKIFYTPFPELFAKHCIQYCFPELGWSLELSEHDPPDLIDVEQGIGVEVTSAIMSDDAELDSMFDKYAKRSKEEIPAGVMKKFKKHFIFSTAGNKEILHACIHDARSLDNIQVANGIIRKTERLNSPDYPKFKLDALFVNDSDSYIWEKEYSDIQEKLNNEMNELQRGFKIIFVYCHYYIVLWNLDDGSIRDFKLKGFEIEKIKQSALREMGYLEEYFRLIEEYSKRTHK